MSFDDKELPTLTIRYSDGGTFNIRAAHVRDFVFDPSFLKFFTLQMFITALLLEPYGAEIQTSAHSVIIWVLTFMMCMIWLLVSSTCIKYLLFRRQIVEIHTLIVILPMIVIGQSIMRGMDYLETGQFASLGLADMVSILKTVFVAICFDIIHGRYVAPFNQAVVTPNLISNDSVSNRSQEEKLFGKSQPPISSFLGNGDPVRANGNLQESQSKTTNSRTPAEASENVHGKITSGHPVQIGAKNFVMGSIRMIRSEEHYLRVYTDEETVLIRGKLSEAEAKLDPSLGMQINRSIWIAYRSIAALETNSRGRLEVITDQNDIISVPNSRKIALTKNFRSSRV